MYFLSACEGIHSRNALYHLIPGTVIKGFLRFHYLAKALILQCINPQRYATCLFNIMLPKFIGRTNCTTSNHRVAHVSTGNRAFALPSCSMTCQKEPLMRAPQLPASLRICVLCEGKKQRQKQNERDSAYLSLLSGCPWATPSLIPISAYSRVAGSWENTETGRLNVLQKFCFFLLYLWNDIIHHSTQARVCFTSTVMIMRRYLLLLPWPVPALLLTATLHLQFCFEDTRVHDSETLFSFQRERQVCMLIPFVSTHLLVQSQLCKIPIFKFYYGIIRACVEVYVYLYISSLVWNMLSYLHIWLLLMSFVMRNVKLSLLLVGSYFILFVLSLCESTVQE